MQVHPLIAGLAVVAWVFVTTPGGAARAEEFVLLEPESITEKFETSLRVLKERLDAEPPPRYMLYKAEVTFSKSSGMDGQIEGRIPVLLAEAEVTGAYQQLATASETLVYTPRPTIPTNFDDSGLLDFLGRIHAEAREEIAAESAFIPTRAIFEEAFFIQVDGEGKLSFLSVASVSGGVELRNAHQFRFHFCLVGNDGTCVEG